MHLERRKRWLLLVWRIVRLPLIAIGLGLLMLTALQDKLLHYPERLEAGEALREAAGLRLSPWPADGGEVRGWLREPKATATTTLVLFHGNGGHALHRVWLADELSEQGVRVVLAEHPGYGHRSGGYDEAVMVSDAVHTIRSLRAAFSGRLIVAGESLGAGVAAAALAQSEADAALLITPWNRLADIAAHHYPWLPVGALLRDRYDSVANLQGFSGPKMVIVAGSDEVIPPALGRALYEALPEPRRLLVIPGRGHNDWMERMTPAQWQEVLKFLREERK